MKDNIREKQKNKRETGGILIFIGVVLISVCIGAIVVQRDKDSKVPEDAERYNAVVAEILHEERRDEYSADNSTYEIMYSYQLLLEYKIDGKEYMVQYHRPSHGSTVSIGDIYYVSVSSNDPNEIYEIKGANETKSFNYSMCNLAVVGLAFILFGVLCYIKSRKHKVNENNQMCR